MSSINDKTLPATRRLKSRKSLAHIPSSTRGKENMTMVAGNKVTPIERPANKTRSKSIGPGGLDTLTDTSGNRRKTLGTISQPPPRSILKPTIPPLREIPAHTVVKKASPNKLAHAPPTPKEQSGLLIDFDIGLPTKETENGSNPLENESSAAVNESRVTLRTEDEQQAAANEREEKERLILEHDGNARRDARRKSLANRRVSFAPEATLHTWDVVVEYQDSTTSSNSTTRRASAGGTLGPQISVPPSSESSKLPSTPPELVEETTVKVSPAHQRDLHQKKRRRSSGVPRMNFDISDDMGSSSSPDSGSSFGDAEEAIEEINDELAHDSDNDGTISMDLDPTDTSAASVQSTSDPGSTARLDESLKLAVNKAGIHRIGSNGQGDASGDDDSDIIGTFRPWTQQAAPKIGSAQLDQENVNPFSPAFRAVVAKSEDAQSDAEDMTMDITQGAGGILPNQQDVDLAQDMTMDVTRAVGGIVMNTLETNSAIGKCIPVSRRQSTFQISSEARSSLEDDKTTEFTTLVGGVLPSEDNTEIDKDEDMTMEFTTVIGGVLPPSSAQKPKRRSLNIQEGGQGRISESVIDDTMMDMTGDIGRIILARNELTGEEDHTMTINLTTAMGSILPPQLHNASRSQAKRLMELETDAGSSPMQLGVPVNSPSKSTVAQDAVAVAFETGSPRLAAFQGHGLRRSTGPKSRLGNGTPVKISETPPKQFTPKYARKSTTSRITPASAAVISSPKRLFTPDAGPASTSPRSSANQLDTTEMLLMHDTAGNATPSSMVIPQKRRSSGVGIDRTGLGSPRIAELLDRRGSLGEYARSFVPRQIQDLASGLRFADPRTIEEEIRKDREQDEERENGRKIMEREADSGEEKDATLILKGMISSLTPKKKSLKGRKSLHIGAAKGLLGKRPAELDEDEDDDDNDGVKRIKTHQGSPVKKVKLQGPPSKAETTDRKTRTARRSLEDITNTTSTPSIDSSPRKSKASTPRDQGRFRDAVENATPVKFIPTAEQDPLDDVQITQESYEDDRIQLQDFLNLTSIRFMELTTTKRRHTIAPKTDLQCRDRKSDDGRISLEDCVATGAATIPMLELFQHACHELKNYIAEGRKTVREIETETFEENPPLFREYLSAMPEVKLIMDNQLKNVKTHARLLSKGTWYQWRLKLLETLQDGLLRSADGMNIDEKSLGEQEELLNSMFPQLLQRAEDLELQEAEWRLAAEELANCDPGELSNARQQLITIDTDLQTQRQIIEDLQMQLEGKEIDIETTIRRKQVVLDEIQEADKIREECRGWSSNEISVLKAKVDALEAQHGWTITGISGKMVSMTYKKEIELVFDASSFHINTISSPAKQPLNPHIHLRYIAASRQDNPIPSTTQKDFLLSCTRDHIRALPQSTTSIRALLSAVSTSWNQSATVEEDIRLLTLVCPTAVETTSENTMLVRATLLIAPLTSKVHIQWTVRCASGETGFCVGVQPAVSVVYGERFNEDKMRDFLVSRCGLGVEGGGEGKEKEKWRKVSWGSAVGELGEKLLARVRK